MPRKLIVLIAALALTLAFAATASASVTSHICSGGVSRATFVVPQTDQYEYRLAAYNASGVRIYLSVWVNRGGLAPNRTDIAAYRVPAGTARALVIWRAVNAGVQWNRWANC